MILLPGGRREPQGGPGQVTVSFFWVVVMVLVATYSANLMSSLAVTQDKLPFTTLRQVTVAILRTKRTCVALISCKIFRNYYYN